MPVGELTNLSRCLQQTDDRSEIRRRPVFAEV